MCAAFLSFSISHVYIHVYTSHKLNVSYTSYVIEGGREGGRGWKGEKMGEGEREAE